MPSIIDISLPIGPDLVVWPGNPEPRVLPTSRLADGGTSNVSEIRLGSHTGTHVDPPFHTLDDGATVDQLPLDALVGAVEVVDLTSVANTIDVADLAQAMPARPVERVLFKTRNSARWHTAPQRFATDYVSLSVDGARWMVERGIRLVGTDYLSIEPHGLPGHPTHGVLLEAGVVIVEGLDLSGVSAGAYTLACLPLRIVGADGAPARAVLLAG
ncbi:MAG TPA: cyclase family protein [Gemmatimonadaceae bacterium]